MARTFCIQVVWQRRADPLERLAQQCWLLSAALESAHPRLVGWESEDAQGKLAPIESAESARQALLRSATRFTAGGAKHTAYAPRFTLPRDTALSGEFT